MTVASLFKIRLQPMIFIHTRKHWRGSQLRYVPETVPESKLIHTAVSLFLPQKAAIRSRKNTVAKH